MSDPFEPYASPDYTITFVNRTSFPWLRSLLQCTVPKLRDLMESTHPLQGTGLMPFPERPGRSTTMVALKNHGKDTGMAEPGIVSLGYNHGAYPELCFECRFLVDPKTGEPLSFEVKSQDEPAWTKKDYKSLEWVVYGRGRAGEEYVLVPTNEYEKSVVSF